MNDFDWHKARQVVARLDPQATLQRVWPLRGGVSAQMTALEFAGAASDARTVIVRRAGAWAMQQNPAIIPQEYAILQAVTQMGVKAQRPYWLDTSGEIFADPYMVIEYIEGAPRYAPADSLHFVTQMASHLAALHRLSVGGLQPLAFLPDYAAQVTTKLATPPAALDLSLDEGRIRDALTRAWPPASGRRGLLHGDFWPGNLLWRGEELVAVIDWEDAALGDPLADFATTRLDVLWLFGEAAMQTFSTHYASVTGFEMTDLPVWDLVAALRPAGRIDVWAAGWPEMGRPDITPATMRAGHRAFVEQALARLSSPPPPHAPPTAQSHAPAQSNSHPPYHPPAKRGSV